LRSTTRAASVATSAVETGGVAAGVGELGATGGRWRVA
jgi:hypothetical protein